MTRLDQNRAAAQLAEKVFYMPIFTRSRLTDICKYPPGLTPNVVPFFSLYLFLSTYLFLLKWLFV
jgi:hypothetical protein